MPWQIDRYIETNSQLDTIGRWTPWSSKQRCLPYHYTNYWIYCTYRYQRQMDPPSQASRDACHTTTPTTGSIAHIDTKARWTPPWSSKQRCLPYHYTNYWIYCTYRYQRQMNPPSQASRDACHTTTPTTGSIAHIDTKGRWTPLGQASRDACHTTT